MLSYSLTMPMPQRSQTLLNPMPRQKLHNFVTPICQRFLKRSLVHVVLGTRVCTMLEKEPSNFYTLRLVQWSPLVLVPGCRIGAVLEKESSNLHASPEQPRRLMQRSPLLLVLSCRVCAVHEEK